MNVCSKYYNIENINAIIVCLHLHNNNIISVLIEWDLVLFTTAVF